MTHDFTDLQRVTAGRWREIAATFGVDPERLRRKHGPCPFCGGRDRFRYDDRKDNGSFHCNQCGGGDGFDLVARALNTSRREAVKKVAEQFGMKYEKRGVLPGQKSGGKPAGSGKVMRASTLQKLIEECICADEDTVAYRYLTEVRGLEPPECDNLAYHPSLPYRDEDVEAVTGHYPCLIGRVQSLNGTTVSLHRIYLDSESAEKAPVAQPKKSMPPLYEGAMSGAAVRLGEPDGVLGVAEGIETGLYCQQATGLPVWCGLTANGVRFMKIPKEVDHVVIFADNDKNGTGQNAAYDLAEALQAEGKSCQVLIPPREGNDWLDEGDLDYDRVTKADYYDRAERWPDPAPLSVLPPVPKYQRDMLPEPLATWAWDIGLGLQSPPEFAAVTLLSIISTLIGAGCSMEPKQNWPWPVIPNIWGAVVGEASIVLKSPSMDIPMNLLLKIDRAEQTRYEALYASYKKDNEMYQLKRKALQSKLQKVLTTGKGGTVASVEKEIESLDEPLEPRRKPYISNDATIERLKELFHDNPRGIMLYCDELTGMMAGWEREGRQQDKQFYLQCWKGYAGDKTHRVSKDREPENCCLTLFGGIQPDKLKRYLYDVVKQGSDGFMARIQLLVYPDVPDWTYVDPVENQEVKEQVFALCQELAGCDFEAMGAHQGEGDKRPKFKFSQPAQVRFVEFITELESVKLRQTYSDAQFMREHVGKFRSLMPALALIFHLIDCVSNNKKGNVSLKATEMAIRWCTFLEAHALRVYSLVETRVERTRSLLIEKINQGKLGTSFTVPEITRAGWRGLDDKATIYDALANLEYYDWLRKEEPQGLSKLPRYLVNPKVWRED